MRYSLEEWGIIAMVGWVLVLGALASLYGLGGS